VCSREHPRNATQEETRKGASDRRLSSSGQSSSPRNNPSNHQPQTTAHPHIATTETGRPEEPLQQPTQLQVTEAQEDQEQE
jgi:hypothetical protein